jgi:hypothetical protein
MGVSSLLLRFFSISYIAAHDTDQVVSDFLP